MAVPVTSTAMDCYQFADIDTACNILAKHAIEIAKKSGLSSARKYLQEQCIDTIQSYKNAVVAQPASQQQPNDPNEFLCPTLQLLPLYIMSLQKNITFRGGTEIRPDERMFMIHQLNGMPVNQSRVFVYPNLYALHSMTAECGKPIEGSKSEDDSLHVAGKRNILLPPTQKLRAEILESNGLYLLEDSVSMYMWIGKSAPSELLQTIFGVSHEGLDCRQLTLQDLGNNLSSRVNNIVQAIREENSSFPRLIFLKEGDHAETRFFMHLVEERANFADCSHSYPEYLKLVTRNSGTPTRGGGGKGGIGSAPYHSGGSPAPHQAPRGMAPGGARGPGPQMQNFGGGLKGQKGAGGMPLPPQKGQMMPRGQPMMPRGSAPNLQPQGQMMPTGGAHFQQQAPQQYGGKGMGIPQAPQIFGGKGMGGPPGPGGMGVPPGGPPGRQVKGGPPPNMQQAPRGGPPPNYRPY